MVANSETGAFADPLTHLRAELNRLDLLLHRQILRLRASYQLSLDEFRGLYVSDEHVDSLIRQVAGQVAGQDGGLPTTEALTAQAGAMRRANAARIDSRLPWRRLVEEFGLSAVEQELLLIGLAPEIDLKYETLFAYLNNDVSRKWPTRQMALHLLGDSSEKQMACWAALQASSTLFRWGLLQSLDGANTHPSWLAQGFRTDAAVTHFLLGLPGLDALLTLHAQDVATKATWDDVPVADDQRQRLQQVASFLRQSASGGPLPILVLEGRSGNGRALAAGAICRELALPLLRLDVAGARMEPEQLTHFSKAVIRRRRLYETAIYVEESDALYGKEGRPHPETAALFEQLTETPGPLFFAVRPGEQWHALLKGQRYLTVGFPVPGYQQRRKLWSSYAAKGGLAVGEEMIEALASRFTLTPGQIQAAVTAAVDSQFLAGEATNALDDETLFAVARVQSDSGLGKLAVKVKEGRSWQDLVLPAATLRQIQEIAAAIEHRHVVYSEWGFSKGAAAGRGLKVLFAGASGTGKTMTAGVMARDLGLDLYKIDLSGVVSKYIGETEKNLDRIFRVAQSSNAILFFDEADALFGKRSEVKDAHDRYANIEISYLLQKMEEHEGAVILASNLRGNIDDAFSRRMHYVIEFPLPDERMRLRLWKGMFPRQAPLGEDVDFRFLAGQFEMAGGDIRNVVLDAAFLAAQDGRMVTMRELIRAMARQMRKQGKMPTATTFKQYHSLIVTGK